MDAEEARQFTQRNLKGPLIIPVLKQVYSKIQTAASDGKSFINHPFDDLRPYPSPEVQEAVYKHLVDVDKYKVMHHEDADPGHPASRPYTTVSWKV